VAHEETSLMATDVATTSLNIDHRKLAMWTFLGSEFLLFGALISAYLLYLDTTAGGPGVEIYDIPFTSISSFVLLMSSLTMVLAHHAHTKGDMRRMRLWLLATVGQGAVFLGGQVFEFNVFFREGLTLGTSPFSSAFYVTTGFHGLHVFVGILLLSSLYVLSLTGKIKPTQHVKTEIIGLYWHFVDIVWVIIFTVVYLIPELAVLD
jgi:heme/copper-type cytochrome/quinol oxidase subunit 3